MAATNEPEKVSGNLNELLEDALDELLLEDDEVSTEVGGKLDVKESLKKITEIDKQQEYTSEANGSSQQQGTCRAKKATVKQPKAGASSDKPPPFPSSKVIDEEEMNRFFASMTEKLQEMPKMDQEEAQAKISESVPQIFDLMQNLLSKELLYPALSDLAPKFDQWLEKNLASLSKEDRRRYKKQVSKIKEIIEVFDDESLDDQERFEKNLELMEQMQALGAPPEELTVPEGMNRCSIM